jgi:DNA-binding MarR family transcriptional regulator
MAAAPQTPLGRLKEKGLHQLLGYQLAQASITTSEGFQNCHAELDGLRPVEFTLLSLIAENAKVSSARLAKALAVTKPNITMWVDRLVERQWVQRKPSLLDKRATELQMTPAGVKLVAKATQALLHAELKSTAALSSAERAILIELLHKVANGRR